MDQTKREEMERLLLEIAVPGDQTFALTIPERDHLTATARLAAQAAIDNVMLARRTAAAWRAETARKWAAIARGEPAHRAGRQHASQVAA
jgi:hypothetical protein